MKSNLYKKFMEKSNHELAIEWWLKLNRDDKHEFAKKFYQTYWIDELTGNEIGNLVNSSG
jgi:hypothetical protein